LPYIENPKTAGSGIMCAIPQDSECPVGCEDCFFQSGRSYLEPLSDHLPNLPDPAFVNDNGYVVRINDGNDSNVNRNRVVGWTNAYNHRFFNTSIPKYLDSFPAPVVLTVNPGPQTDIIAHMLSKIPVNLMFVRVRTNRWNLHVVNSAVDYYAERGIPTILTFMAYHDIESIPEDYQHLYSYRKRTSNEYWAITEAGWVEILGYYYGNHLVYSCGTEGEGGTTKCERCGNCLREYFRTKVAMQKAGL
jgi:hypothetical protein